MSTSATARRASLEQDREIAKLRSALQMRTEALQRERTRAQSYSDELRKTREEEEGLRTNMRNLERAKEAASTSAAEALLAAEEAHRVLEGTQRERELLASEKVRNEKLMDRVKAREDDKVRLQHQLASYSEKVGGSLFSAGGVSRCCLKLCPPRSPKHLNPQRNWRLFRSSRVPSLRLHACMTRSKVSRESRSVRRR